MAQKQIFNFQEDDSTVLLNLQNQAALSEGRYRGYDFDASSSGLNLVLSHLTSGMVYTKEDVTASAKTGAVRTKQGVWILEDAAVTIPVVNNAANANPRIDLIVVEHEYVATPGGTTAGYVVIQGTPSATPVAPTLTFPTKQVIIGTIYWPANAATIITASVVYTQADSPNFNNDTTIVRTGNDQSITGDKRLSHINHTIATLTVDTVNGKLVSTVKANMYVVDNVNASYIPIYGIDVPNSNVGDPILIYTKQKLYFSDSVSGNIGIGGDVFIPAEREFILTGLGGTTAVTGNVKYKLTQGDDLKAYGLSKMFGQLVLNKGTATYSKVAGQGLIGISKKANYYTVGYDFSDAPICGIAEVGTQTWDGASNYTKGGSLIFLDLRRTASSAQTTISDISNSPVVPAGYKPIQTSTGDDVLLNNGALILLLEEETSYRIVTVMDNSYNIIALRDEYNARIQNREHSYSKIQSTNWKNLTAGGTGFDTVTNALIITDEGNSFTVGVPATDVGGVMSNILLKRGTAGPTTAPTGTIINVRFQHTAFTPGANVPFSFDLSNTSNIVCELSTGQLTGGAATDFFYIQDGLYGVDGEIYTFRKTSTKWEVIALNYFPTAFSRIAALETLVATGAWQSPTFNTGWASPSPVTTASGGAAKFRKLANLDRVEFQGTCTCNPFTNIIPFTLPVGYRPTYYRNVKTTVKVDGVVEDAFLQIAPTGVVTVANISTPTTSVFVYLDGLNFQLT